MKKIIFTVLSIITMLLPTSVKAKQNINVYLFSLPTCHYCQSAKEFFAQLASDSEYSQYFTLVDLDVKENNNSSLATKVTKYFGDATGKVPYIVIGNKTYLGYSSDNNASIKAEIKKSYNNKHYTDLVKAIEDGKENNKTNKLLSTKIIASISIVLMGILVFIYSKKKIKK